MKKGVTIASTLSTSLLTLCATLVKVGGPVFLLVAGYLMYASMSGLLRTAQPGIVHVLQFIGELLFVSGVVTTAALILVTLEEVYWSVIAGALGVVLLMGAPAMTANLTVGGQTPETAKIVAFWASLTGKAMIALVVCRVIYEIYRQMAEGSERRRIQEEEVAKAKRKTIKVPKEKLLARCWEMPFCHDAVRELCPAFKEKKTCWKYGRGCNCDPDLVETLIGTRHAGPKRGARSSEAAYILQELEVDQVKSRAEKTIPCARCPIYTEHQRRKFRVVNPLLIVITVALVGILYGPLTQLYSAMAMGVARLIIVSGDPNALDWWKSYLDTPALAGAFVVIIALFSLSWILKIGEWLVLEKKLV